MSLIKCKECGNMISDKAPACIHCGCPMSTTSGKLLIKACKHPRQMQNMYGCAADIYLYKADGTFLASLKTGSTIEMDIKKDISLYASFYKNDKNCLGNNLTRSNVFHVKANTKTKLQISFAPTFLTIKIIISKVDCIDSD